ncbi:hypothetical protein M404DRAFT_1007750 [Pisolithus tinctorius Marx 270]|uniref:Uncharacterized protein n=1 Tax=Pisolithus tinctorius Marx 270 TaxID=870435 RepID=A0A0C3IDL3_PISTI|nr:hypothetical protein M404DRAFT_1007750 [Pisolithus tinctorius Marx 270]
MHIRLENEVTTETQLQNVIDATSDLFGRVSEFCVSPDYRQAAAQYAFFLELQGDPGKLLHIASGDTPRFECSNLIQQNFTQAQSFLRRPLPCMINLRLGDPTGNFW